MKRQYIVTGMTCAACQGHVERAASKVSGAGKVSVSLLTNAMTVEGDADPAAVVRAVEQAGYGARLMDMGSREKVDLISQEQEALVDRETPRLAARLTWSAIFLMFLMYITMGHNMLDWPVPAYFAHNHLGLSLTELLLTLAVMMVNRDFFISGFRSLRQGAPNMDVLVALGSGVSFLWSLYVLYEMTYQITQGATSMDIMGLYHDRLYFESAAMIPALITVGKLLESISKGRTTDALKSLLQLSPKEARVLREGEEITVPASDVVVGDMFLVKPGEAIPVDGVILEGEAAIDESALTGESVPVEKSPGSRIPRPPSIPMAISKPGPRRWARIPPLRKSFGWSAKRRPRRRLLLAWRIKYRRSSCRRWWPSRPSSLRSTWRLAARRRWRWSTPSACW